LVEQQGQFSTDPLMVCRTEWSDVSNPQVKKIAAHFSQEVDAVVILLFLLVNIKKTKSNEWLVAQSERSTGIIVQHSAFDSNSNNKSFLAS